MAKKIMTRDELIALMKRRQGKRPNNEFAEEIGISAVYLGDVYMGKKAPGPKITGYFGLARVLAYEVVQQ